MVKVNSRWMSLEDVARIVIMEREAGRKPKKWMRKLLDSKLREMGYVLGDKIHDDKYIVYKSNGLLNIRRIK